MVAAELRFGTEADIRASPGSLFSVDVDIAVSLVLTKKNKLVGNLGKPSAVISILTSCSLDGGLKDYEIDAFNFKTRTSFP